MWLSDLLLEPGGWELEVEAGVSPCKWEAGKLVRVIPAFRLGVPELLLSMVADK